MPQGVLPFQYQGEAMGKGMTGLCGLGVYLDFLYGVGIPRQADQAIGMRRTQGYTDGQMVVALVLLNLAGGRGGPEPGGLGARRGADGPPAPGGNLGARAPRDGGPAGPVAAGAPGDPFPPSAVFRYLGEFHDEDQEERRTAQDTPLAFIPTQNRVLQSLTGTCLGRN